ncbi:MAG: phage tail family protein [Eubacteriales bacterium]|nr:phage tail family protein [Eubacteriales bacterium]
METTRDFYFNNYQLSHFNGIIASDSGMLELSLAPSVETVTAQPYGYDGLAVTYSYLNPRVFSVPVLFDDIDIRKIRNISSWLTVKEPKDFYFVENENFSIKLKVMLDNGMEQIKRLGSSAGRCELKFIAHDPHFYEVNPIVIEGVTSGLNIVNQLNFGSVESLPLIELGNCPAAIEISLQSGEKWVFTDIPPHIVIDSQKRKVWNYDTGENLYNSLDMSNAEGWIKLAPDNGDSIVFSHSGIEYKITPRMRWL